MTSEYKTREKWKYIGRTQAIGYFYQTWELTEDPRPGHYVGLRWAEVVYP